MPAMYTAMKNKFAKTLPMKAAKTKAAKIFNARRKPGVAPVTNKPDKMAVLKARLTARKAKSSSGFVKKLQGMTAGY